MDLIETHSSLYPVIVRWIAYRRPLLFDGSALIFEVYCWNLFDLSIFLFGGVHAKKEKCQSKERWTSHLWGIVCFGPPATRICPLDLRPKRHLIREGMLPLLINHISPCQTMDVGLNPHALPSLNTTLQFGKGTWGETVYEVVFCISTNVVARKVQYTAVVASRSSPRSMRYCPFWSDGCTVLSLWAEV